MQRNPDSWAVSCTSSSTNCPRPSGSAKTPDVWFHRREPSTPRMLGPLHGQVLGDAVQEAVPVLLPEVLCQVPLRPAGYLREQAVLPLLQQLEDQARGSQVPVIMPFHSRPVQPCARWPLCRKLGDLVEDD